MKENEFSKTLCFILNEGTFLALEARNSVWTVEFQQFLQASRVNFMEIQEIVSQLTEKLKAKQDDPVLPKGC